MSGGAAAGSRLSSRPLRVAIVGRGFTGAAAAIAIAETGVAPAELLLIDPSPDFGKGLAYGKARDGELLNVRSRDASIFPDRPDDFLNWLGVRNQTGSLSPDNLGDTFMSRATYGGYVADRAMACIAKAPLSHRFVQEQVTAVERDAEGRIAVVAGTELLVVDAIVLATGYGIFSSEARFGRAAFSSLEDADLAHGRHAVLVGTGLTMVDMLFRLRDMGFSGTIDLVSRRGILPAPHTERAVTAIPFAPGAHDERLSDILHAFRGSAREAVAGGQNWQGLMNGFRPIARQTWQALGTADQNTFLRHLKPYYFAHRHRLPPASARRLRQELSRSDTRLRRAAVLEVDKGIVVLKDQWTGTTQRVRADLVIDCSGHQSSAQTPLMKSLLEGGLASRPRAGAGIDVAPDGRVLAADGRPQSDLFALGPLGQGALLEITGIREIVEQSRAMAAIVAAQTRKGLDAD